ncbi:low temperature requirement protein A [Angustibacter luteus]
MVGRDPDEQHRASTPLELLFDLTFVVAVAQVSAELAHAIVDGSDVGGAVVSYLMTFFAIWWAWVNFTWFASAYDSDDVPYRLLTLLQMLGVLILASAVPQLFEHHDFTWGVIGYVVMRIALVGQWLRAAAGDPAHRTTARRYAVGVTAVQVGWVAFLAVPQDWQLPAFVVLAALDMLVPVWAERTAVTPWHSEHIAERYGLFVIIVLGECVLGATAAVQQTLQGSEGLSVALAVTGAGGLLLVFAVWWLYFLWPFPDALDRDSGRIFAWGYVHYGVFAALAALGSGLEVAAETLGHHEPTGSHGGPDPTSAWALAIPVAAFLLMLTLLGRVVAMTTTADVVAKCGAALVTLAVPLLVPGLPWVVLLVAAPVVALDARGVWQQHRAHRLSSQDAGITG